MTTRSVSLSNARAEFNSQYLSILKSMDPANTIAEEPCCPSFFYQACIDAASSQCPIQIEHLKAWASNIAGRCLRMTLEVTEWQQAQQQPGTGSRLDIDTTAFRDLIGFLSGMGVACTELQERMSSTEHDRELHDIAALRKDPGDSDSSPTDVSETDLSWSESAHIRHKINEKLLKCQASVQCVHSALGYDGQRNKDVDHEHLRSVLENFVDQITEVQEMTDDLARTLYPCPPAFLVDSLLTQARSISVMTWSRFLLQDIDDLICLHAYQAMESVNGLLISAEKKISAETAI